MKYLECDFRNAVKVKELKTVKKRLERATKKLERLQDTKAQGFFDLPFDLKTTKFVEDLAADAQKRFDNLIVVGIGGASLGAQVIDQALNRGDGLNLYFAGTNTDPDSLSELLSGVDLKRTAINVVSKSGTTMETMSAFMILRQALIKKVGKRNHASHVFCTTDLTEGVLHTIAQREGYTLLPHPINVGGRYSVLSTVGLFPAACAGINIRKLLTGARSVVKDWQSRGVHSDSARFAALHYLGYKKRGQNIHVCMPYTDTLSEFGFWFCQLWSESLGKSKLVGPTPVAALGATDQHSELQLYLQGPKDKIITLIKVKKFETELEVPDDFNDFDQIAYFQNKKLSKLNHVELEATAKALKKSDRAYNIITIPKVSAESLGALFMFYEIACAYTGQLFEINAYNQPGVQLEKQAAKLILNK